MTIQPTQVNRPDAASVPVNPKSDMGPNAFMKLLVAELKQQDPLDPMQAREMVTQLSQLSTVEKLTNIDKSLGALHTGNAAAASLQTAGLIGRSVTAETHRLALTPTKSPIGHFQLLAKAHEVVVHVRNAAGQLIRSIKQGAQGPGSKEFLWDGKGDDGMRAPDGAYSFDISAKDDKGVLVRTSTEVTGRVTEVTYENGAPEIVVGGARIPLGDVTTIAQ